MPGTPSAIPVGTQFSPALFDLAGFLTAIAAHDGDKVGMMDAIWQPGVRTKATARPPTHRMRSLPIEAAVQYGLLSPSTYRVTDLTRRLLATPPDHLDEEFARHILLNLGGLRVVEAAQRMKLEGRPITGDSLAQYLTDEGFPVTVHNTAINTMRLWLARAGVFIGRTWEVDPVRKAQLVGLDDDAIAALVGLSAEQRAFVEALCRIDPVDEYPAAEVRNLAESIIGRRFARESLPNAILEPLKQARLIDYRTGGTRGGKTSVLWTTPTFRADVLSAFLERAVDSLDAALMAYYRRPPSQIYQDLESTDTSVKGLALEAYAIHIMRLMGLRFVGWRKRAKESTGQAEIDVVMAGSVGGLPTRWQVQCKNTPGGAVRLDDVAKEVGLLPLTNATHILMLANGRFTADAVTYAREIMRHAPVTIFLLDATDFQHIRTSPGDLPLILRAKAEEIASLAPDKTMWNF